MSKYYTLAAIFLIIGYFYLGYVKFYYQIGQANLTSPNILKQYYFLNGVPSSKANFDQSISSKESLSTTIYKYVALGDSLTAGVGTYSFNQSFPFILAQRFSKQYQYFELVNLSSPGARTIELINTQLPAVLKEQPNMISLLIGVNDLHNFQTGSDFKQNYATIVNQLLTNTKANVIIINLPYLGGNMLLLPPYNFFFDMRTRYFNQIISQFCASPRIQCIDLYNQAYQAFQNNPSLYSADFFHPSDKGYLLWSNSINAD